MNAINKHIAMTFWKEFSKYFQKTVSPITIRRYFTFHSKEGTIIQLGFIPNIDENGYFIKWKGTNIADVGPSMNEVIVVIYTGAIKDIRSNPLATPIDAIEDALIDFCADKCTYSRDRSSMSQSGYIQYTIPASYFLKSDEIKKDADVITELI
jgi:hypothetical protein